MPPSRSADSSTQRGGGLGVGEVDREAGDVVAVGPQRVRGLLGGAVLHVTADDAGAFAGEHGLRGLALAARRAGDQYALAFESHRHVLGGGRDQWSREGRSTGPHWFTVARSTCQVFGYIGYSSCHGRGSQ
jgi:hypothetical protein